MSRKHQTLSEQLRQAVVRASVTRYRITQDTGITQGQLSRFVHGKCKLSQDSIDTLAGYLGLEIAERQSRKRKGG